MKIESGNNSALPIRETSASRAVSSVQAQDGIGGVQAASPSSSTVSLSSMSTLRTPVSSDIDMAKVASIKAAIRDGSYKIDSGKIADGMMSTARDLMQASAR